MRVGRPHRRGPAPADRFVRPEHAAAQAHRQVLEACSPVASMAVMLRSRRITMGGSRRTASTTGCILSVVAEEEWAVDPEDRTYSGMSLSCRMCARPLRRSRRDRLHGRRARDATDEEQRREDHPDLDRQREVGEDRQAEGHEPDDDVGLR
jgi:hypothetical protein